MTSKRRARLLITMMALLLIGGLGWRLYATFGGSSEGTVRVVAPKPEIPAARKTIDGPFASFSYGPSLQLINTEPASPPVLANYSFSKQQFSSWQASVQITSLPTGQLRDAGTYNFRDANPTRYQKTVSKIGDATVTYFTDQSDGGYDRIAYLNSGSKVASIMLAGGTPEQTEAMQTELETMVTSWRWR